MPSFLRTTIMILKMMNNTIYATYIGDTLNQREVREMSAKISSSVNSEIAKQLRDINLSVMSGNTSKEESKID